MSNSTGASTSIRHKTVGSRVSLPSDIRKNNRRTVLRALYPDRWLSRADIAKTTGLSKVSTSDVVADLIDDSLLVEGGFKPSSKPGKPALLVGMHTQSMCVMGIDLSEVGTVQGILTDLQGRVIARSSKALAPAQQLPLEPIVDLCNELTSQAPAPILGLGVATPGTVNENGTVLAAPNLGWTDLNLAAELTSRLGVQTYVTNDADSAAFGERCFAQGPANMIVVQIARGVGAGVLIDNHIVRGSHYVAGEIGHVVVDENGIPCACGKRGCLETLTSVPFLESRIVEDPGNREDILAGAGEALGAALSMPVALINITDIVISGPTSIVDTTMLNAVENTINDRVHSRFIRSVHVHPTVLGTDAAALGSVACVLRHQLGVL
ncbi:ROK family protein [Bombiscardovia apis]|uniref:ROK family protein n=1 Tax=Bombiscardovia apis TaxID=2932182 RepID=A0ABM8BCX5_9BIFI|nr:ROK family protein [Bombiscardovia apis]BDR54773.1 ROK family protein [Bombiscardovia apis]